MATVGDTTPEDVTAPGPVTERTDKRVLTDDDIPSGLNGPFFQQVGKRKLNGRDAKCLVTAKDGDTGVGKSNACDFLAYVTDTTGEGFTPEKATIEPMRFLELYSILEPGSAAVMEEGEQFDSRRAMTNENVEATHKWQKARVREIVAFVNLPDPTMIDGRFERLCDYWINIERRGLARIYKKRIHPTKRVIYYETLQTLEWPNMDGSATFRHMDDIKASLLDGELNNDSLIRQSEAEKQAERAAKNARQDCRDRWIYELKQYGMNGTDIARLPHVDITSQRVNKIAKEYEVSSEESESPEDGGVVA
jgi:hypothetical protein